MKKVFSMGIVICMMLTMIVPAFANQLNEEKLEIASGYVDISRTEEASPAEIVLAEKYKATAFTPTEAYLTNAVSLSEKEQLLTFCTEISRTQIGDTNLLIGYSERNLKTVLAECRSVTDVFQVNGILYISYVANDGKEVILSYSDSGFYDLCAYNSADDTAIYISQTEQKKYINCRNGTYYEMTEETLEMIYSYIDRGDYEGLSQADGISVIPTNGGYIIEEELPKKIPLFSITNEANVTGTMTRSSAPTTDSELYQSLLDSWPMQNSVYTMGTTPASQVIVLRNNYIRIGADWEDFEKNSTLSAIATALAIASKDYVELLLQALGIAFSGNTLLEEVRLCRSATYEFSSNKKGLVYDNTVYNDYVYVVQYSDRVGTFAGGFDPEGDFVWIYHAQSPTWNMSNQTVSSNAVSDYNWDVSLNGYCSSYNPSGFW